MAGTGNNMLIITSSREITVIINPSAVFIEAPATSCCPSQHFSGNYIEGAD